MERRLAEPIKEFCALSNVTRLESGADKAISGHVTWNITTLAPIDNIHVVSMLKEVMSGGSRN